MGLFSRRKSSTQSFGPASTTPSQHYTDKSTQLHTYPGQGSWDFDSAPVPSTPLYDSTSHTNNAGERKSFASKRHSKTSRPVTAQSAAPSSYPTLTPKLAKKTERPPSAASRVFVTNGRAISRDGKTPQSKQTRGQTKSEPILFRDISSTSILRTTQSMRSLKVKSVDLLKSNPRLSYLTPTPAPPPSRARNDELLFHHDGRGLFASKTVANLADDLDAHGLRKLLERDSRRRGQFRSSEHLRKQMYQFAMPEEIPSSPRARDYDSGYPIRDYENWFGDPGPSTIRPVLGSHRSSNSIESKTRERMDSGRSFANDAIPRESTDTMKRPPSRKPELPPILLFGQSSQAQEPKESPILLLGPNSARSTETQSTHPNSFIDSPIQLLSRTPIDAPVSQEPSQSPPPPAKSPLRPRILSFVTDTGSSIQDNEYETAEEFGSETPGPLTEEEHDDDDDESIDFWHESPVIPRDVKDLTPKPSNLALFTSVHTEDIERTPTQPSAADNRQLRAAAWPLPKNNSIPPSDTESLTGGYEDEESNVPIFSPETEWMDSPIIGNVLPDISVVPPRSQGSMESEGSWLSGKLDIEKAVRKSFAGGPVRRTPPIILETSPVKGDGNIIPAGFNSSTPSGLVRDRPDYEGADYGSEEEEDGDEVPVMIGERVRQGSAARKVEVVDRPSLEGVAARVSGESPERSRDSKQSEIIIA